MPEFKWLKVGGEDHVFLLATEIQPHGWHDASLDA
jgi:hypothetical protein